MKGKNRLRIEDGSTLPSFIMIDGIAHHKLRIEGIRKKSEFRRQNSEEGNQS